MPNVTKRNLLERLTKGDGIGARVARSSASISLGNGALQALRLVSNLVLSRLLFPEAFGLMALVTAFITGLQMQSDAGTRPSIMRHERGARHSRYAARTVQMGQDPHGTLQTIAEVHAEELPSLMPLGGLFDGFVEHAKRVSPICLVHFECNRYSVPASFANRPVSLRVYPARIVIAAEGQILREHERIIDRSHRTGGQTIYDTRHYLAVIQSKPGALRNGAPFTEMPDAFRQLQGQPLERPAATRK